MSIINSSHGFVFVHVPKSAGTSVTSVLSGLCSVLDIEVGGSAFGEAVQPAFQARHGLSKHSTAAEIRALLGEQQWMRMVSFGVVRHPLARLASAWRFLRQWDSPGNFLREALLATETFEDFLATDLWVDSPGLDRMFQPQAFWLAHEQRDELLVDTVCKVETLDADLHALLSRIGVPVSAQPQAVPRLNATVTRQEGQDLPEALRAKVRDRYARDLQLFGYTL